MYVGTLSRNACNSRFAEVLPTNLAPSPLSTNAANISIFTVFIKSVTSGSISLSCKN